MSDIDGWLEAEYESRVSGDVDEELDAGWPLDEDGDDE